jgi:exonuclease SbcC
MIPQKLSLTGFLSYRDSVEVDFSQLEVACISGANGAGKSSLLDAITFALFGQARKRDESLINAQSVTAEVVYTFDYEGNIYRVQRAKPRGKSSILEFHIQNASGKWKALTERTIRDTDALIQQTLRLDYETFVNASFFLQGKADQFTQQRPADRKRILSSILGLETWEQYRSAASERRRSLDNEIKSLDGRLQEIHLELGEEDVRKANLKQLTSQLETLSNSRAAQEKTVDEMRLRVSSVNQQAEMVSTLAAQLAANQTQQEDYKSRLSARQEEKAQFEGLLIREKEIKEGYTQLQTIRAEIGELDKLAIRFQAEEKKRNEPLTAIESEKARLETERDALIAEETQSQEASTQILIVEKDIQAGRAEIAQSENQSAERDKILAKLETAKAEQISAKAENPHLRAEMEDLESRIKQISKAKGATCPSCGQSLTEEHRQEMIELWGAQGKEKGDRFRANKDLLAKSIQDIAKLEKALAPFTDIERQIQAQTRAIDQAQSRLDSLQSISVQWTKERAPRLKEIKALLKSGNFAKSAREKLAQIDSELKAIGYDAAKHDALRASEKEKRAIETELRQLEQANAALKPLQREIGELETQVTQQTTALAEADKAHTKAATALAAVEADLPDVRGMELQLLEVQESENTMRQEVGAAKQRVAVLDDLRQRKAELDEQREKLAAQVGEFQSLERAFGKDGVPAMLIEQALPQIELRANEVLERLSGGQMHINFVTQQAYKDAKREDLRETLEIQISDSAGERDYEMFSGGEAFRINFAIRLALSKVLAQRAGARLQTLVIDEGFGSQDEIGRQRLVEAINLVKEDFAKILVITHIDSLKDAFPSRIEVSKTNSGSMVSVN